MPSVANHIRLGIFRDRPVFEDAARNYDRVVVPAHIAAYSGDGLWGFMTGVGRAQGRDAEYFFDPMTYWLALPPKYWGRGSERGQRLDLDLPLTEDQVRPAFWRLLEAYGLTEAIRTSEQRLAEDVLMQLPRACLEFQRRGIANKTEKTVTKYAKVLGIQIDEARFTPDRLVAAYLPVDRRSTPSVRRQRSLNTASLENRGAGESLWGVVAFETPAVAQPIDEEARAELSLEEFDGVGLWIGGLDEYASDVESLRLYRDVVRSLDKPVWLLFGGYYGALLSYDGVTDLSHGVLYTESKRVTGPVGSGPPADRYYVRPLHRFYDPARAIRAMELAPELRCRCSECADFDALRRAARESANTPANRVSWGQRLQRHFIQARDAEMQQLRAIDRKDAIDQLAQAAGLIGQIPTAERSALGLDTAHLDRWQLGLSAQ
jgi:hypothetical protein